MTNPVLPPDEFNGRILRRAEVAPLKRTDVDTFSRLSSGRSTVYVDGPRLTWWITQAGTSFEFESSDIDGEEMSTLPAFNYLLVTIAITVSDAQELAYIQIICVIVRVDVLGILAFPCGIEMWYGNTPNPKWIDLM